MSIEKGLDKLSKDKQVKILYDCGISPNEIAVVVGYTRQWVYRLIKREGENLNEE